jgi:hypothetical protein
MCYPIQCPVCEHRYLIDCIENDYWDEECPECEEEFKVQIEPNPILVTEAYNYKICLECGKKFDKDWRTRSKFSDKYKNDADVCSNCCCKLDCERLDSWIENEKKINKKESDSN